MPSGDQRAEAFGKQKKIGASKMTVRITEAFLRAGQSGRDGWTKRKLALLGVNWPPRKGWKRLVIGQDIPESVAEEFLAPVPELPGLFPAE